MRDRQREDGQALGDVGLHPRGQSGRAGAPGFDGLGQQALGLDLVGGVEDRADVAGHLLALLSALRDQTKGGLARLKQCEVQRQSSLHATPSPIQANLTAKCIVLWYTAEIQGEKPP